MKRYFLIALVLLTCPALAHAGKLEKALQRRWLGAWVVTTVETYSNCGNAYTVNRLTKTKMTLEAPPGYLLYLIGHQARRVR